MESVASKPKAAAAQLPSLTPLRGIAALWVVFYHYTSVYLPNLDSDAYSHFIGKGYLAVDMFFMLSGFVMTHVYQQAFCDSVTRHYRGFLVARIARLYPLHLLILLLFVATAFAPRAVAYAATGAFEGIPLSGARSLGAFVANIFMVQGLAASKLSWNYPSWSISVEFMAYLLFPLILPVIWRATAAVKVALALCLAAALGVFAWVYDDNFNQWSGAETLARCLPEFFLGTLLYSAFRGGAGAGLVKRDTTAIAIVAAIVVCLHFGISDLAATLLFAALILAAVANTGTFAKALNVGPLVWLGDISYSLYLVHGLVQFIATELMHAHGIEHRADLSRGGSFAIVVAMLAACLLCTTATYYGVEISGRRYLRDLFGGPRHQARRAARAPATVRAFGH